MPAINGNELLAIGIAIVVVVLLVVGRRLSSGASIVDQLPRDTREAGPDLKPTQTGRKPDIGPENESQNPQPPS